MHTCTRCNKEQDEACYGSWPRNKWCRTCAADYQRELRSRQPNYRGSGRNKALKSLSKQELALHRLMVARRSDIMQRQRRFKVPGYCPTAAELVELWNKQSGRCALSGQPMDLTPGPSSVSVDQIDPRGGYTLSNIQLTTWAVNRAKGDLSTEDFLNMCRYIVRCNDYPERE